MSVSCFHFLFTQSLVLRALGEQKMETDIATNLCAMPSCNSHAHKATYERKLFPFFVHPKPCFKSFGWTKNGNGYRYEFVCPLATHTQGQPDSLPLPLPLPTTTTITTTTTTTTTATTMEKLRLRCCLICVWIATRHSTQKRLTIANDNLLH